MLLEWLDELWKDMKNIVLVFINIYLIKLIGISSHTMVEKIVIHF